MEIQNLRIAKTTLGKGEVGELLLIETQHKATVMESFIWHKDKQKQNRTYMEY